MGPNVSDTLHELCYAKGFAKNFTSEHVVGGSVLLMADPVVVQIACKLFLLSQK